MFHSYLLRTLVEFPLKILRFFKDKKNVPEIQVLATDLDPVVLGKAKKGFYPAEALKKLAAVNRRSFGKAGDTLVKPRRASKRCGTVRKLDLISER